MRVAQLIEQFAQMLATAVPELYEVRVSDATGIEQVLEVNNRFARLPAAVVTLGGIRADDAGLTRIVTPAVLVIGRPATPSARCDSAYWDLLDTLLRAMGTEAALGDDRAVKFTRSYPVNLNPGMAQLTTVWEFEISDPRED